MDDGLCDGLDGAIKSEVGCLNHIAKERQPEGELNTIVTACAILSNIAPFLVLGFLFMRVLTFPRVLQNGKSLWFCCYVNLVCFSKAVVCGTDIIST